jgi:hypothetical protein
VSLAGGLVGIASTVPFLFLGANTSYVLITIAMLARGLGVGLSSMPAMTAAFRGLSAAQVNDATPQLNVLQRVGGSIGTALVTVILQKHLTGAGADAVKQAHAFDSTFLWVIVVTAVATLPTIVLMRIERRAGGWGSSGESDTPAEALVGAA